MSFLIKVIFSFLRHNDLKKSQAWMSLTSILTEPVCLCANCNMFQIVWLFFFFLNPRALIYLYKWFMGSPKDNRVSIWSRVDVKVHGNLWVRVLHDCLILKKKLQSRFGISQSSMVHQYVVAFSQLGNLGKQEPSCEGCIVAFVSGTWRRLMWKETILSLDTAEPNPIDESGIRKKAEWRRGGELE